MATNMSSLTTLRAELEHTINACQLAERELIRAARKEGTLSVAWDFAASAADHLRNFDHLMAEIKSARQRQIP